ncbi:DUF378 domain-containing protein [candidate division WWE3 bacterium]|nr:DUF378 domain-containing protein [candidate division WWE3 bacterium]
MKLLQSLSTPLVVVAALNWALTGLFGFDFVSVVLRSWPAVQMVVYVLVLAAALQSLVRNMK